MEKTRKLVVAMGTVALMFMLLPITTMAVEVTQRQVQIDNEMLLVTEMFFTEEQEEVYLEPGKVYLFTYLVDGEGWEVENIEADDNIITAEKWKYQEEGKVSVKVEVKEFICASIKVHIKNRITGEKKLLTCELVDKPVLRDFNVGSSDFGSFSGVINDTVENENAVDESIDEPTVEPNEPNEEETVDKPSFNTPTNNGGNEGENKEPDNEDEEDDIVIEKITIQPISLTDENIQLLDNGNFKIKIPNLPNDVDYACIVNGQEIFNDEELAKGTYVVSAKFNFDPNKYNPIEQTEEVIYHVKESPTTTYPYGLELRQVDSDDDGILAFELVLNANIQGATGVQLTLDSDMEVADFKMDPVNGSYPVFNKDKGTLYLITNYLFGENKTLGRFEFKKGSEDKLFDIINMSNIKVLDRNSKGINIDDIEVIVSDLPVYEIELNKPSTFAEEMVRTSQVEESTSTTGTENTSEATESTSVLELENTSEATESTSMTETENTSEATESTSTTETENTSEATESTSTTGTENTSEVTESTSTEMTQSTSTEVTESTSTETTQSTSTVES